jgi:transglutaminase-like putative cysteine protease
VIVRDSVGQILPQISKSTGSTQISFDFIDQVVGKNKVNNFSVSYQTHDIASRNGSIWEINIPRLEGAHETSTYSVTVTVPSQFGSPAFISPSPDTGNANTFYYSPHLGYQPPITAVFGTTQYMEFQLDYHLENSQPVESWNQIALPPDTAYQQVLLKQIEPRPEQVEQDADGNWLADYRLSPGELLSVQAAGLVKLEFQPKSFQETKEDLSGLVGSTEFWQADDQDILSLADKLKTPKAIYQYLVDHLNYSFEKVNQGGGRLGASAALKSPDLAICTEFTDLFVALTRAAGIPARELEGYAFTTNDRLRPLSLSQDILHAWPEYYDRQKQTWIQVDPTWGKTTGGIDYFSKLDLNHVVFAIHGVSPIRPAPAGSYKLKANPGKDVEVHATSPILWPDSDLAYSLADSQDWQHPAIIIRNVGQVSAGGDIALSSDPPGIIDTSFKLQGLPPYGYQKIALNPNLPWSLKPISFTLLVNDGQRTNNLGISAKKPIPSTAKVSLAAGVGLLGATALAAWRLRLRRRKRTQPLHW